MQYLDFEKRVAELDGKAEELRALARNDPKVDTGDAVEKLVEQSRSMLGEIYTKLTPWQRCQIARHPQRPHAEEYLSALLDEFTLLAGDRGFAEDNAVIGGLARFRGRSVMVIAQEKGHDTQSRLHRNFGMARPEGYRKAIRLMEMAERFKIPIVTLIDTPGAYPGKGAEERGQSEAIARSTEKSLELTVPMVAVVIGEGGSGGAVAFATANRIAMLEHSIYSVISPEGCASILWKSADRAEDAAAALKLTAQDLLALGVIDRVVPEPLGGAQREPKTAIAAVGDTILELLDDMAGLAPDALRADRRRKFLEMGKKKLGG
ncbi:MAG: acetyl-CoA carboxylase carboxyltransferase subunit alpha [Rhodobacteraceae bacterium]|nr:acetyl-CoA carboxylase carboxyltransferase subunit alpha [Paracoccaceae bacterium]